MKTSNRTFPYLSHGTAVLLCSMTVVLCMLCTPAKAQQFGQWDLDMYSTSMYINPSGNNYAEVTCMTAFSGSVASSWTPYSNDYCITPVGAAYAAGIGYDDDEDAPTVKTPRPTAPPVRLDEDPEDE